MRLGLEKGRITHNWEKETKGELTREFWQPKGEELGEEKVEHGGVLLWVGFGQREKKEEEESCV